MQADRLMSYVEAWRNLRSDYAAARQSRFRRRRPGVPGFGAAADYHYRSEADYLRIIEYARDMDRNDAVVGQMVDRAVINTIQNGFSLDPQTGDPALDQDLWQRFDTWANDPELCDAAGEMTFADMQELVLRSVFVDGDIFALPRADGRLQLLEAHRCRTPGNTRKNVIHGILLDENRRRLQYWFTRQDIDPRQAITKVADMIQYPARDTAGQPLVFHVYNPKRVSQTRGVSSFAPIFDILGMFEDINFAKLVQQQVVSCFAILWERAPDFRGGVRAPTGAQQSVTQDDGTERIEEAIAPGMEIRGLPGEKPTGFSPNVPNPEFFPHVRLLLQIIGVNLGLPLVMVLMDASETNFSGWRGAVDQARMGFLRNQRWLRDRFHRRVYQWKVRQWIAEDRAIRRAADSLGDRIYAAQWSAPRWPYIQPLDDARADRLRLDALLTSPRRLHAERGQDYEAIVEEAVADRSLAIRAAIQAAKQISDETNFYVDWRMLLGSHIREPGPAPLQKSPEE